MGAPREVTSLRDLSPQQWKSGIAAWLGWLFDGLDMHLYVLVAAPFVAQLSGIADEKDPLVRDRSSIIQAAFLFGWAFGGAFFGIVGDRLGRSRALILTILTYAFFTGLSYFATAWWHMVIFRFLAALGIGGEWAVGASLLSETWPKRWRPWMAAVLQTGVNLGVIIACFAAFLLSGFEKRTVFLVGIAPALLVLWIRRAVPETDEWHAAKAAVGAAKPSIIDLFRGATRRISVLTLLVCALALTGHWAFLFWSVQQLRNHPDLAQWADARKSDYTYMAFLFIMLMSILGNFVAALLARKLGYRRAIIAMCLGYTAAMAATYFMPLPHYVMWIGFAAIGICQGVFGLFTMYLPPLFPTLLRTTGAGFCYNFGRIAAGVGTVVFGLYAKVGDYRTTLLYAGFLFIPAALFALLLPEPPDEAS